MMEVSVILEVDTTLAEDGISVNINSNGDESFDYVFFSYYDMIDSAIEGFTITRKNSSNDAIAIEDYNDMITVARGLNQAASYIVAKLQSLKVVSD